MNSTFTRAFVGFIVLTLGLTGMAMVALGAMSSYAGSPWWAMLLIILVSLVAEVSIYSTTLHEPIHDWIREPKLRLAREKEDSKSYEIGFKDGERKGRGDADRNSGQNPQR